MCRVWGVPGSLEGEGGRTHQRPLSAPWEPGRWHGLQRCPFQRSTPACTHTVHGCPRRGELTLAGASLQAGSILPGAWVLLRPPPPPQGNKSHPKWHQRPCWVEDSWTHYILGYLGLGTQQGTEEAAESTALFCSVRNHPTRVRGPWSSDGWGQFSLTSWEGAGVTSANPSPLFPHVTF